jgi:hypothetical protein
MTKTITVKMTATDIAEVLDQPVLVGSDANKKLRAAGIPASGKLWPYRVERGVLVTTVTPTGMTFVWTPPEESDDDLY